MKKVLALVILASLMTSAAPPTKIPPTFAMDSCTDLDGNLVCDTIGVFTFSGDNYSTKKDYLIYVTSGTFIGSEITPTVDSNGHMTATGFGVSFAGAWTFTIWSVRHNGAGIEALGSETVDFADYVPPPQP